MNRSDSTSSSLHPQMDCTRSSSPSSSKSALIIMSGLKILVVQLALSFWLEHIVLNKFDSVYFNGHPLFHLASRPGPSRIPGYPGIPGLILNPDPGILENLIPGFFGIYPIKENSDFKDFYWVLTQICPKNPGMKMLG